MLDLGLVRDPASSLLSGDEHWASCLYLCPTCEKRPELSLGSQKGQGTPEGQTSLAKWSVPPSPLFSALSPVLGTRPSLPPLEGPQGRPQPI